MTPKAAQLQHPTDDNGYEYQFDSKKPMTDLVITASLSGTLSASDPGGSGLTNTVTYSGTLTATLTRATFVPIDYYPDFTLPTAGEFFLVSDCCCWQCRWDIITPTLEPTGSIDWTSTWTGAGAPANTSGSLDAALGIEEGFIRTGIPPGGEGYAAMLEAARASLCRAAGESGRLGQIIRVTMPTATELPANGFSMPLLDWTYTDTNGTSSSSAPGDTPPEMEVESASCGDTVSVDASLEFDGTDTSGGVTSTVTALKYEWTFALT